MSARPAAVLSSGVRHPARGVVARLTDYAVLTKARLTLLVLASTATGFILGSAGPLDTLMMLHATLGTALVAGAAAILNQVLERDVDALMVRTAGRPLPARRVSLDEALYVGVATAVVGTLYLLMAVNVISAALAALTLVLYLAVYTPLKRVTELCLPVGAVPGALPPLIGYAAAHGGLTYEALLPAMIVFFWQFPHFLAISWMYRDDYARGGFAMLAVHDPDGRATARQVLSRTPALVIVSLLPAAVGLAGAWYAASSLLLGVGFIALAAGFGVWRDVPAARRLFIYSIIYLSVLFVMLIVDRAGG
ncbi:MAG: protoheme IX farnesyltransferase [Phycisphaerae bacterium]|nr:heme o synthase [Phycisphaerae bacterium]NUQ45156.1 protoheme IX farnesyltransferase [Phycisphaerae bacterium]